MSKVSKNEIRKISETEKEVDYEKLRIDILKTMIEDRGINCKQTKEVMVKYLKMDDEDKYIRPVEIEKSSEGKFIIKVDLRDSDTCREMGKLVEKGIAQRMNIYSNNKIYYISKQKPI